MIVADSEDDAAQSTPLQPKEELFPACGTLSIGHLYPQHLAPAFPVNADGHQHRSRANDSIFA